MKTSNYAMFRAIVTACLFLSLVMQPLLVMQAADIKSAASFKSEASLYDNALRTIGGITSMKLDSPDALKQALAIFDREHQNLRFHFSKRVAMVLADPTFGDAVNKLSAKPDAAKVFIDEVNADRKAVLKLEGAQALANRIQESSNADAALLRKVAQHLKDAAARIQKSAGINSPLDPRNDFKLFRVGYTEPLDTAPMSAYFEPTLLVMGAVAVGVALLVGGLFAYEGVTRLFNNVFTDEGHAAVLACEKEADDRLKACLAQANTVPFPFNLAAIAGCDAEWLLAKAGCLVTP